MPDAYEVQEGRFVQWKTAASAADATTLAIGPVPDGKVWTILAAGYWPSVTETRVVEFQIYRTGNIVPITEPASWAYASTTGMMWTGLREGMEIKLFPGESLMVERDDHTAGSTMNLRVRYIETDLPLYTYVEPQLRKRQAMALSSVRSAIGTVGGAGRAAAEAGIPSGVGGRRSLPR